ncbi:MAG: hypothetical protein HC866_23785 [Leptolyngbyaceae cyanobacterium RU_5_1]|nr:hypothetical protein [Leptolyngbyaceae cyanobacterium RU_5_1]
MVRRKPALYLKGQRREESPLEIDITSKSLNRMPIYARLGVPEVWRYDDGQLKIYLLEGQEYVETDTSRALPMFPVHELIPFIDQCNASLKLTFQVSSFRDALHIQAVSLICSASSVRDRGRSTVP